MADKPILFSAPMVRALLAGTKTQTRRTISPKQRRRPNLFDGTWADEYVLDPGNEDWRQEALRIKVGDRLWVKETTRITSWGEDGEVWVAYTADGTRSKALYPDNEDFLERLCARVELAGAKVGENGHYEGIPDSALVRPSIFMPRWASRITLTVTDVRVQRLQEISEGDAIAEGVDFDGVQYFTPDRPSRDTAAESYRDIWIEINGEASWEANPWVAAYTFTVALGNIDSMPGGGNG